jgi:hypothetical protein
LLPSHFAIFAVNTNNRTSPNTKIGTSLNTKFDAQANTDMATPGEKLAESLQALKEWQNVPFPDECDIGLRRL